MHQEDKNFVPHLTWFDQVRILINELDLINRTNEDKSFPDKLNGHLHLISNKEIDLMAKIKTHLRNCIIAYPIESHSKNFDALLWRYCFHQPIDMLRRKLKLGKNSIGFSSSKISAQIQGLIDEGLAFFPELIFNLIKAFTDIDIVEKKTGLPGNNLDPLWILGVERKFVELFQDRLGIYTNVLDGREAFFSIFLQNPNSNICIQIIYRLLIFCGDLGRYRCQLIKSFASDQNSFAALFYSLAYILDPKQGHAANQLAVLHLINDDIPSAILWYFRAIIADTPFPAAINNMRAFLDKCITSARKDNSPIYIKWYPLVEFVNICFEDKESPSLLDVSDVITDAHTASQICCILLLFSSHCGLKHHRTSIHKSLDVLINTFEAKFLPDMQGFVDKKAIEFCLIVLPTIRRYCHEKLEFVPHLSLNHPSQLPLIRNILIETFLDYQGIPEIIKLIRVIINAIDRNNIVELQQYFLLSSVCKNHLMVSSLPSFFGNPSLHQHSPMLEKRNPLSHHSQMDEDDVILFQGFQ